MDNGLTCNRGWQDCSKSNRDYWGLVEEEEVMLGTVEEADGPGRVVCASAEHAINTRATVAVGIVRIFIP